MKELQTRYTCGYRSRWDSFPDSFPFPFNRYRTKDDHREKRVSTQPPNSNLPLIQWKSELEEILAVALIDPEQWVLMLAEMMKTYPATGTLNTDICKLKENK
ncbi:unnamed protein product [Bemisia tabaci]|uniref:HDAg domain-containing protein n=1 Tax=Bemisia tabaci TaxID=7038 RepID=A0A9P0AC42_BEMTA|nr:unnamed protein product [Bemisia tabaci]